MKKMLIGLLCLGALTLFSCGMPESPPEEGATSVAAIKSSENPMVLLENNDIAITPIYALSPTHLYAMCWGGESPVLYCASLDDLSHSQRIPLPRFCDSKLLRNMQLYDLSEQWIFVCGQLDPRYYNEEEGEWKNSEEPAVYALYRIALDTFIGEFIELSDKNPANAIEPEWADTDNGQMLAIEVNGKHYGLQKGFSDSDESIGFYRLDGNGNIEEEIYDLERPWGTDYGLARAGNLVLIFLFRGERIEGRQQNFTAIYDTAKDELIFPFAPDDRENSNATEPRDYIFNNSLARTPTHLYAGRSGVLYSMPINDIGKQEKIALPKGLQYGSICGVNEDWLFVNCFELDKKDHPVPGTLAVCRIALGTGKAEVLLDGVRGRYNEASDSIIFISERKDRYELNALKLDTGKSSVLLELSHYVNADSYIGWFNTPDGMAVLENVFDYEQHVNCVLIDKTNGVRLADGRELSAWKVTWAPTPPPPNAAEQRLEQRTWNHKNNPRDWDTDMEQYSYVKDYITCGEYVYYIESGWGYGRDGDWNDFYRIKIDGSDKKLLRKDTNIFSLWSVNDTLCALAWTPDGGEEMGFYSLDENGKLVNVIAHGFDGEWSGTYLDRMGDLLLLQWWGSSREPALEVIYAPSTGAAFLTNRYER